MAAASPAPSTTASITVLMDSFEGKRLNSPNDIVVKSDDSIWFTDMDAGIAGNWNGEVGEQEMPQRVYRIDGKTGKATIATDGVSSGRTDWPSRRTRRCSTSSRASPAPRAIYAFDVAATAPSLPTAAIFIVCDQGRDAGRLPRRRRRQPVVRLGHGHGRTRRRAHLQPAGRADRPDRLPERAANVCFGGPKRNRLFMAASHSVYALYVNTQGALGG